ncbi:hypothetical protein RFI_15183 [Reticulomyxa filosa]|uniref:Cullin N-terminal domain-containing protein n=1 Tax=Reticulomyxa filosa TaxID=46433 RepID=X6N7K5_RETFI|nr:hypothetical protein RFI_15183 [Reticulomyxa filosa]|eukprot:ETO22021.1 hypothetical protein RFI_15183 [Reticulomyxa filosa]
MFTKIFFFPFDKAECGRTRKKGGVTGEKKKKLLVIYLKKMKPSSSSKSGSHGSRSTIVPGSSTTIVTLPMNASSKACEISFEEGWKTVNKGLQKVLEIIDSDMKVTTNTRGISHEEFSSIYTTVYNMCLPSGKLSAQLYYDKYRETLANYLMNNARKKLQRCKERFNALDSEHFLMELVKQYRNYKILTKWLMEALCYLDRFFVTRNRVPSLREVASREFYQHVFESIREECIPIALRLVEKDRDYSNERYDNANNYNYNFNNDNNDNLFNVFTHEANRHSTIIEKRLR